MCAGVLNYACGEFPLEKRIYCVSLFVVSFSQFVLQFFYSLFKYIVFAPSGNVTKRSRSFDMDAFFFPN